MFKNTEVLWVFLLLCLYWLPLNLTWFALNSRQPTWLELTRTGICLGFGPRMECVPWEDVTFEELVLWHLFPAIRIKYRGKETWLFKEHEGFVAVKGLLKENSPILRKN